MVNDSTLERMVGRLEADAQARPRRYRLSVILMASIGNAWIAATLLGVALVPAALARIVPDLLVLATGIAALVCWFVATVLNSLHLEARIPIGVPVEACDAPALFEAIESLRAELDAPAFDTVLVTGDYNAFVIQMPRTHLLRRGQNYLLVGLPLMKSLSVDQFRSVLAHEFGHLASGHGRLANWIYRQSHRWNRLNSTLAARRSAGRWLFTPFLQQFSRIFNAWSCPLARVNEYEADAISARLTSARSAAEALTNASVVGRYLSENYWPTVHQRANAGSAFAPFFEIDGFLASGLDRTVAMDWLERALAEPTFWSDTHPSLADRLGALGCTPALSLPAPGAAADRLLGPSLDSVTRELDMGWNIARPRFD